VLYFVNNCVKNKLKLFAELILLVFIKKTYTNQISLNFRTYSQWLGYGKFKTSMTKCVPFEGNPFGAALKKTITEASAYKRQVHLKIPLRNFKYIYSLYTSSFSSQISYYCHLYPGSKYLLLYNSEIIKYSMLVLYVHYILSI